MTIATDHTPQDLTLSNIKQSSKTVTRLFSFQTLAILFSLICLCFCTQTHAQNVAIPVGNQGNHNLEVPSLGMTMANVREIFGQADREQGPVGNPPITIWYYSNYRVYFEYTTVIHSVLVHSESEDN
jgi:hypothetical protein